MVSSLLTRSVGALRHGRTRASIVVVALVAALFGATFLAAGAAGARTVSHSRSSYEASIANRVLGQLNGERRAHHLKALSMSRQLQLSARRHDTTMARYNTLSHQLPHEAYFATRIRQAGYKYKWAGENVAWNSVISTAGVQALQSAMYNERAPYNEHRLNILNSHFRNVGIDVFIDRVHHKVWMTTDFGSK